MGRRKGAIIGAASVAGLSVVQGQDLLVTDRFNTRTAEHYFCSRCGIYTPHRRRWKPNPFGYNVGCLEGEDPNQLAVVPVSEGLSHPADRQPDPAAMAVPGVAPRGGAMG